ncbi:TetR/AcrR family transcriptional regulator [Pleionea sediminis]|uniref:TetR/AcrR family transcriptional regulator n=1 Tax=Pleionea sediminis TaxID=2569479 RepID=UPI0011856E09|nr:TetR family transcriptional regulator [Pleionea sediminis]
MNASRGRPIDSDKQQEQKLKLLQAARELLDDKTYKSITVRDIASQAGVNSAMVRYYFSNKEGLFVALFQQLSKNQFEKIKTLLELEDPLKQFIPMMIQMACQNRGLIRFVHDEVLTEESSLKKTFIEGLPRNIATFLPQLIQRDIQKGRFREDLNPKSAAFSLMSLIMLPIVIDPVREDVWQIPMSDIESPQWANHIYQLFINGCSKESNQ